MVADTFYKLKTVLDSRKKRCLSRIIGLERSFESPKMPSKQDIDQRVTGHTGTPCRIPKLSPTPCKKFKVDVKCLKKAREGKR